ncbi:hypothetical protein HDU67_006960, partial [Dinochytrium kinnereticum]
EVAAVDATEGEGKVEAGTKVDGVGLGKLSRDHLTVSDELSTVTERFVESRILPMCLELFFQYPWNNFLHSVVYDMIAKVFNTYSFTSTANLRPPVADGEVFEPSSSLLAAEERLRKVKESVFKLVISILVDGKLTERISAAQRLNDYEVGQPKGVRLGYMGHLTYISDEVCKLIDKCAADFDTHVKSLIVSEEWQEYLSGVLRETKERDRQPLGGVRPTQTNQPLSVPLVSGLGSFGVGNLDDSDIGITPGRSVNAKVETGEGSDEDEDDIGGTIGGEAFVADGDVSSDQYARYLCQQIVSDFPDRGILGVDTVGDAEDVEEGEADWVSDLEVKDVMDGQNGLAVGDDHASIVISTPDDSGTSAVVETPSSMLTESENVFNSILQASPQKTVMEDVSLGARMSGLDNVSDLAAALPGDLDSGRGSSTVTGSSTPAEVPSVEAKAV